MSTTKDLRSGGTSFVVAGDRLDSWKEIAAYLKREVRTVQRWEKTESLPVHRLPHDRRGSVYAFRHELDGWMAARELAVRGNARTLGNSSESANAPTGGRSPESDGSSEVLRHSVARNLRVILSFVILGAAGIWAWRYFEDREISRRSRPVFDSVQISRLTEDGNTRHAAITPDGKYVVHEIENAGLRSLWARQVATGREVQILPPTAKEVWGLSLTPDGNYVYATMAEPNGLEGELDVLPILGGPVRKILNNIDSPVGFSPDGRRIAFLREDTRATPVGVFFVLANADGSNEVTLIKTASPHAISSGGMSWSPDGRRIAFGLGDFNENKMRLMAIDVSTGELSSLSAHEWRSVGRVAWTAGGNACVLQATDFDNSKQIWIVQGPEGRARRLTADLNQYNQTDLSPTTDARTILVVQEDIESHLWVGGPSGPASQITFGSGHHDGVAGLDWTTHDQIVYSTAVWRATGELSIVGADGHNPRPLTANGLVNQQPAVTSDGNSVIFASTAAGVTNIWSIRTDGSALRQLTSGKWDETPGISLDGNWIFYASAPSGNSEIFRIPTFGGKPEAIVHERSIMPRVSPDGKLISYHSDTLDGPNFLIRLIPFGGGATVVEFTLPVSFDVDFFTTPVQWAPGGSALTYVKDDSGVSNLWNQPLDKSAPKQITHFASGLIYWFAWSRDGNRLALAQGRKVGDAILLRDDSQKP